MKINLKSLTFLFFLIISSGVAYSQSDARILADDGSFYFDAIVFRGDTAGKTRLDVYAVIPYESLSFISATGKYAANFDVNISIFDTTGNPVVRDNIKRKIFTEDYAESQGATAKFDYEQKIYFLVPGEYKIKIQLEDNIIKKEYEKSRLITLLDFRKYNFALSGILLVSSIEENNGKYKITPYLSDNVANLKDGFFSFFEVYNNMASRDSVDFVYEFADKNNETVWQSKRFRKSVTLGVSRQFIHIDSISVLNTGSYTLKIYSLPPDAPEDYTEKDVLALTQRSITYMQSLFGNVLGDIDLSIRQLRFVANSEDLDFIESGKTSEEKKKRFEAFWQKLDPTPGTARNEAFDDYYSRITYANKAFKSYTDGWMTDKGMVYVIYGPPQQVDRQSSYEDGRIYERWIYGGSREFWFVDNTGFGDYRLYRPAIVSDKYQYKR